MKRTAHGHRPMSNALEKRLADCNQESKMNCLIAARTAIQIKVFNQIKMLEFAANKPADFIASAERCNWFMTWHNLCIRAQTKLAQKLPKELENKIEPFQQHVNNLHKKCNFETFGNW